MIPTAIQTELNIPVLKKNMQYTRIVLKVKLFAVSYIGNIIYYLPSYLVGVFYGYFYSRDIEVESFKYVILVILASLLGMEI